jgi:hypothetical protein
MWEIKLSKWWVIGAWVGDAKKASLETTKKSFYKPWRQQQELNAVTRPRWQTFRAINIYLGVIYRRPTSDAAKKCQQLDQWSWQAIDREVRYIAIYRSMCRTIQATAIVRQKIRSGAGSLISRIFNLGCNRSLGVQCAGRTIGPCSDPLGRGLQFVLGVYYKSACWGIWKNPCYNIKTNRSKYV